MQFKLYLTMVPSPSGISPPFFEACLRVGRCSNNKKIPNAGLSLPADECLLLQFSA